LPLPSHAALVRFRWKKYGPFGKLVPSDNLSQRSKDLNLRQPYITVRFSATDEGDIPLAEFACVYQSYIME
jgi:hypothetical protein